MKLKNLFLPLIAITMCAGFASCDDDDDNDDQEYINSLENVLIDGFHYSIDDPINYERHDLGWLIYRCISPIGVSVEELFPQLPDNIYDTTGIFERLSYVIAFNRDHTFTLYEYTAEDLNDIKNAMSGNWHVENRDYIVLDVKINGKMEHVNVKVEYAASDWVLLYMKWPGDANATYYVLTNK